ncbi:LamB/YcsF family protein [Paenibacillus sp. GSMTC-2017]|uniref:LamB/YcsF family protein n=1 Tax=Paenibacillus sp. GSMTC-2017 TaxID=2794350 RepID=UPI0018D7F882|nr:5-oxoprolinase subunit PxpA [Paenibacillus sp. GSMTC-2017]MBH5318987.1 LamB/YcsF family protein [Paenibacillus sp. GSMTC-2017]
MYRIDLNCDMGEGFGPYQLGVDSELIKHITSANIACGFHAGDAATIRRTVQLALQYDVAIGAHPGLPDLAGFGRRKMEISSREAYEMTVYQLGAVMAFATSEGGKVAHIKPHGALYNMAAVEPKLATAIAEAVYKVDGNMMLYGLSGSELIRAGERIGLKTMNEVFADRSYEDDGTLTPRGVEGALLTNSNLAAAQVVSMVKSGTVRTRLGNILQLKADTVCVHGDTPGALGHVMKLRELLLQSEIRILKSGEH